MATRRAATRRLRLGPKRLQPRPVQRNPLPARPRPLTDFPKRIALAIFQSKLAVNRVSVSYESRQISFNSRDPEKAAQIANATADAYVREQLLSKIAAMEQGNEWLEARLNELRHKLNAATQAAQAFRARHDYSIPDGAPTDTATITGETGASEPEAPTLEELEATADTYRNLYGSVLEAFTSSMQHKSYPYSLVRVITPASAPFSKTSPRTKVTLVFGALAGLLLGVGFAIARQSLDGSIAPRGKCAPRSELIAWWRCRGSGSGQATGTC